MKKSRMLAAAMLMLVAPVVTGCDLLPGISIKIPGMDFVTNLIDKITGKDEPVNPKPDDPVVPPTPKEIRIAEIPTATVGVEIDTSSYVTCTGGTGSYYLSLDDASAGFAVIDTSGKKILADHSGTINFTVHYDGATCDGSIEVVSQMYKDFTASAKNAGYDYAYYELDDDWQYWTYMSNFGENYSYEWTENLGLVEIEGVVYTFSVRGEEVVEGIDYTITGNEPETLADYFYKFDLDSSKVKCEYVPSEIYDGSIYPAHEALLIDDSETMNDMIEGLFGYDVELLIDNDFQPTKIEIEESTLSDGSVAYEMMLYVYGELTDGSHGEGLFTLAMLDLNSGANQCSIFTPFFEQPVVGADISAQLTALDTFINGKNFTASYEAYWFDPTKPNEHIANPFVKEDGVGMGHYIHDYLMCFSENEVKGYVTENQTYVEIGSPEFSYGLITHNGGVYVYEGEDRTPALISNGSSVFDEKYDAHNYFFLAKDDGMSVFERSFINSAYSNATGLGFALAGSQTIANFEELFINSLVNTGTIDQIDDDYTFLQQYNDFYQTACFIVDEGFTKYFMCSVDMTYAEGTTNVSEVKITFLLEDADYTTNKPYNYLMAVTLSNAGTTQIPNDVVVSFGE